MSQFETFANELLFDIFEFLSTTHLLHAFLDLNSRFNQLIYTHFRNHGFNLQSICKGHFDIICQQHLSILINNIISLHLSNDDETPSLCELFLSYGFTLDRFIHLKSLSLSHIDSFGTINEIIFQCRSLSYLQKLYLIDCQITEQGENTANMINNIWSLPNLLHCVINNVTVNMTWIYKVSIISSTLESLSIKMIKSDKSALYHFCKSAPRLQRLNINVIQWSFHNQPRIIFSSLISLKTSFQGRSDSIIEFLKSLPNLCSLTLETSAIFMNGYDWQTLLVNYLPKLKIFRLKMNLNFATNGNRIPLIDQLVDSFRTVFWIEEHQWYIRCDCYLSKKGYVGVLYTLPHAFNQCSYLNTYYSISTKSDQDEHYSHNHVQFVDQQIVQIDSFENFKLFNIRFPNIHHLEILLPLIDYSNFLYNLSFNHLISITVTLNDHFGYHQLQTLINWMHRLYSLKLTSFGGSIEGLFQLTSLSIRRLDLITAQLQHELFFNHENCMKLINSSLGRQCEVLVIELENQNDILHLIEKIPHLRVLTFQLKIDILFSDGIMQLKYKKLIRWLKKNISSKCLITIDPKQGSKICIWSYRETNQSVSVNNGTLTWSIPVASKSNKSKAVYFKGYQRRVRAIFDETGTNPLTSNNRLRVREHSNRGCLCLFLFFSSFFLFCYLFIFHVRYVSIISLFMSKQRTHPE